MKKMLLHAAQLPLQQPKIVGFLLVLLPSEEPWLLPGHHQGAGFASSPASNLLPIAGMFGKTFGTFLL